MTRTEQARAILRANDRGGYCVPTARLYPFQWNWDSAFVAMGWSVFDPTRAWQEVRSLLKGQWEDGMIPQIVFHAPSNDYFPGPEVWGIRRTPPTSGITQPPVLATAVRLIWERVKEDDAAAEIYPALLNNHRWWEQARDPQRRGLVTVLHPWETGMDNSPAWDTVLASVPARTVTPIQRRDTTHVDASMRPRSEDYQRFIYLVDLFRDLKWEPGRMLKESPLRVADIGTNAILLRAERDLLALARRFGTAADRAETEARIVRLEGALEGLWRDDLGVYASMDLITDKTITVGTSAGFLPLFAGCATAHAAALATTLARWMGRVKRVVPSTDPFYAGFEPKRYWRGPIWAIVNWMIADGFASCGYADIAAHILADTKALIESAGYCEYFDPITEEGAGGGDFSWTAAMYLWD